MANLSFLIKPASSACNLECDYCFYRDEAEHREKAVHPMMDRSVVEGLLDRSLPVADAVAYAFQGGEPMLVGLPWYEAFVSLVEQKNTRGIPISFALQTNGTLITDEWARFFAKHHFLIGVSLDGFPRLHNVHRRKKDGCRSSEDVMRGIECLRRNKAEFNILTVVTREVANNIDRIWEFYQDQGFFYQQYIPCIDPIGEGDKYLDEDAYGEFLVNLGRKWISSFATGNPVSIRLFDNFMAILCGFPVEACDMKGSCSVQYVIEGGGAVYPCDFYCTDAYYLGSIVTKTIKEIDGVRDELSFIASSHNSSPACQSCPYLYLCRGGCKRYRHRDGTYRFCGSYRRLFDELLPEMKNLAERLQKERQGH